MIRTYYCIGILLWLVSISAFAQQANSNARIIASSVDVQALLASGYSSQKERFEEQCVQGETRFAGAQTSDLAFSQITSQADLASSLGFQVDTRIRYGLVSVNAGAKFMTSSQSSNYSLSAVYSATYKFKNEILTKPVLSPLGTSVREHDERWLDTCGDEYVWQRELGAKFLFSIRIDFASEVDKQYFEANFSLSSPPLGIAAGLQTAKDRLSKKTTVTISALQIGGSVEKLSEMFGGTEDRLAFVQCSTGEFTKCFNVLKTTLDYATDVKTGFPSQISPTLGTEQPGGPAVLAYHTRSYKGAGIFPRSYPLLDEAVKQSRTDLMLSFEELYADKVRLQQILYSKSLRRSQRQKTKLLELERIIEDNKNKILNASQICYETPLQCPAAVSKLRGKPSDLKPVDRKVFNISPESFAQFCDLAKMPEPDPDIKTVVDAVIAEARRIDGPAFAASGDKVDECSMTEDVILRAKRLSLANKGIKDLRPLRHFTHLTGLDLRENQITDLSPLSEMVELAELNVSKNKIRDIAPLTKLPQIKALDLSDNRLTDAMALASLKKMERLDLRNNDPRISCPYQEAERCLTGDFKATNSFVAIQAGGSPRTQHAATQLLNGRVLVTGGWNEKGPFSEIYDEHKRFSPTKGQMKTMRAGHTSTLLKDGKVLVAGGWLASGTTELYDPATDTFSDGPGMKASRTGHSATRLQDGTVLIAGGWNGKRWTGAERDSLASVELYDPATNSLTSVGSMKFRRAEHTATLLNDGKVLLTGGFTQGGGLPTAELYDPATKTFSHAKWRMSVGRGSHTATLLPDGNVLIAGGWWGDRSEAWNTAEIYDAPTGLFRKIKGESLRTGRAWHSANLLSDGRVLLSGGMTEWDIDMKSCTKCLDTAEIFDPAGEMFTPIPKTMSAPRVFHTATPLDDTMVLILGGSADGSSRTGDIYEYKR